MMRGGDIKVLGRGQKVKIRYPPSPVGTSNFECDEKEGRIQVETPKDIRIYLDERCQDTVEWFGKMFAESKEAEGYGLKLNVGG